MHGDYPRSGRVTDDWSDEIADQDYRDYLERSKNPDNLAILRSYLEELKDKRGIIIPEKILEHLIDLEKYTKLHNHDARAIYEAYFQIFNLLRKKEKLNIPELSEEDLGVGLAAFLLHDIGKSGPAEATPRQRELVSRLYNLEVLPKGRDTLIAEAIKMIFNEVENLKESKSVVAELEIYLKELKDLGLQPNELMSIFYKVHAEWTSQILHKFLDQSNSIYRRITKIASSHHYFEQSNPEGINLQNKALSEEDRRDNFLIKMLIVLDQYQGGRRRGNKTPEEAMQFVVDKLAKNGLAEDQEFAEIIALVSEVEKITDIFKSVEIDMLK